jgi:hypothetical protein
VYLYYQVPGLHSQPLPVRETLEGVEVLWQIPPPPIRIKYIMLMFHGCGRRSMSFYYSPEGRKIVQSLLNNQYGVAAFSKRDDENGCWDYDKDMSEKGELYNMKKSIIAFKKRLKEIPHWNTRISHVEPIYHGFGVSNGGHFLVKLASKYVNLAIKAINVQVAAPILKPIEKWNNIHSVYFTIMSRDWNIKSEIKHLISHFNNDFTISYKVYESKALKVTQNFFRKRIPDVSKSLSGAMYRSLLSENIINNNGDILIDPRQLDHGIGPLIHFVHGGKRAAPGITNDLLRILSKNELSRSQIVWIAESLNVAWNMHEINSDQFDNVIQWLQTHSG